MELSKSATQGLGALALVGVLAAAGFLVVKPQIEEAFDLQTQTSDVEAVTDTREIRLVKLETESSNIDQLGSEVDDLLLRIPSSKSVTNIAGAVVESLPAGVYLQSFSHGALDATQPNFEAPVSSLAAFDPPFELADPAEATPVEEAPAEEGAEGEETAEATKTDVAADPAKAGAPIIIAVTASSYDTLAEFIDIMQNQKRLITVTTINSSSDGATVQATIYAYAFTGSTPKIVAWETPEEPSN